MSHWSLLTFSSALVRRGWLRYVHDKLSLMGFHWLRDVFAFLRADKLSDWLMEPRVFFSSSFCLCWFCWVADLWVGLVCLFGWR